MVSGLQLEGRVCSMLTMMLGGDLDGVTRVLNPKTQTHRSAHCAVSRDTVLKHLSMFE